MKILFTDKNELFSIMIPLTWRLTPPEENKQQIYTFEPIEENLDYAFQISFTKDPEKIKEIKLNKGLKVNSPSSNSYSFLENKENFEDNINMIFWMFLFEDILFLLTLTFDENTLDKNRLGNEMSRIRLAISTFRHLPIELRNRESNPKEEVSDWEDIIYWNKPPSKFLEDFQIRFKDENGKMPEIIDLRDLGIKPELLYALLKTKVIPFPNGIYTDLQVDKPIANLFWWDFILESDKGYIHFWRKQSHVELMYKVNIENFDIKKFIGKNIGKYKEEINIISNSFERHSIYINHYMSYKNSCDFLWGEIKNLNINSPEIVKNENILKGSSKDLLEEFIQNNIKFHSLGKSLILNSAFMIESYLNLFIRITSKKEVRDFPDVQKKFLNANFREKLKNLKFYSFALKENLDINSAIIEDALRLMTRRNKYVHFDESSELNKLGEVKFDSDFPVFPSYSESPIFSNIKRIYQNPDFEIVKSAYITANKFVAAIESKIIINYKDKIKLSMEQNPITFNENKKMYSVIFSNLIVDMFLGSSEK